MKRSGLLALLSFAAVFSFARAQDETKKPDAPPPDATGVGKDTTKEAGGAKDAPPKQSDANKAPDPNKAAPVGEVLAAGTVKREKLYPLEDGRTWRYELKTWLATISAEEGTPEEAEPPRLHHMDVTTGDALKIEGKDARCLEWRLDDEPAQRAYYYEDGTSVFCVRRILGVGEHAHEYPLVPPQPVLQGDLTVGSKWTWTGKVGPANGKQSFEVLREERVNAGPLGKLDCLVVRMTFSGDDDSTGVSVKWLSPGVGLVREETEVKADQSVYRTLAVLAKTGTGGAKAPRLPEDKPPHDGK